jgi:hypothetical protein
MAVTGQTIDLLKQRKNASYSLASQRQNMPHTLRAHSFGANSSHQATTEMGRLCASMSFMRSIKLA